MGIRLLKVSSEALTSQTLINIVLLALIIIFPNTSDGYQSRLIWE